MIIHSLEIFDNLRRVFNRLVLGLAKLNNLPTGVVQKLLTLTVKITAIKNGADGYLLKNLEPAQLYEMMECVRRGITLEDVLVDREVKTRFQGEYE